MLIRRLADTLQRKFGWVFTAFSFVWAGSVGALLVAGADPATVGTVGLGLPLAFEILLRVFFFAAFGLHHRAILFNYTLVDHPVYGFGFRPATSVKDLKSLIFDSYVFPPFTGRLYDLQENKRRRLDFRINRLGFRGPEFDPQKKRAKLRIFCSGGSTTACDSVNDDETWPHLLELELCRRGFDVEVVNAGVQAWYSYQEYLRFKHEISGYGADIFLVHQGWNEEFVFSSLRLGQQWEPRLIQNFKESNLLYCRRNRLLSNVPFLSVFMAAKAVYRNFFFSPLMNFRNPQRWRSLLNTDYILAWFENMVSCAEIAREKGILIYSLDYPALVDMRDEPEERRAFVNVDKKRLSPLFLEYQAISKRRISLALEKMQSVIPLLNAAKHFAASSAEEKCRIFHDELHTTPYGNELLAKAVCEELVKSPDFLARYEGRGGKTNGNLSSEALGAVREALRAEAPAITQRVKQRIQALEAAQNPEAEIPGDRYTTF